ncbi:MAG: hypothetical protein ABW168_03575 [Sedimenticola sp.]
MTMPHQFPSLLGTNDSEVVLIVGAGLSYPYAPSTDSLLTKLKETAEEFGLDNSGDFYQIAEKILEHLNAEKSDEESRLELAVRLGLFDERNWFGETGLPISGNTPRHRAIARFAVEKRLRAIISLNWDALMEVALESVGLTRCKTTPMPWGLTAHCSIVIDPHLTNLSKSQIFPVIKPHGCVRDLEQLNEKPKEEITAGEVTFKLTESELNKLPGGQTGVDKKVQSYIYECPIICIGWKAAEGYLRNTIIDTAISTKRQEPDAFTLIDLSWCPNAKYPKTYHDDIAAAYSKTKDESHIAVGNHGEPTLDCLFQWLQARFALNKLFSVASMEVQAILQPHIDSLKEPECTHPLIHLIDSWLPIWVRLCWRTGAMIGHVLSTGVKVEPWDIPITPRDVHVPWSGMGMERRDLIAAAKLLTVLGDELNRFDYLKYPGGLWDASINTLYLPLPGWQGEYDRVDLSALKPLIEGSRGLGYVRSLKLICLDSEHAQLDDLYRKQLAAEVGRMMPHTHLAKRDAIDWVDLETLRGGSNE